MHDFSSCCGQQISLNTTDHRGNTKFTATFSIIFKLMVKLPCTCCILYSSRSNNVVFHSWHLIINGIIRNQKMLSLDFINFWYPLYPLIPYVDSIIFNIIGVNVIQKLIYSSSATTFLFFFHIIIAVIEILAWDLLLFV